MSDAKHRPFVSLSGVPTLRHSVTAFLDVLGFSQLCSLETDITESQRILLRIDNAIREAVEPDGSEAQLYDLEADEGETTNLLSRQPDRAAAMAAQIAAWARVHCGD